MNVEKIMLMEYQKAQDSAEHHDYMSWLISYIFFAASIALIGFLIASLSQLNPYALTAGCLFGIFLIILNSFLFFGSQRIKYAKYQRCKEIEREINRINKEVKKEENYEIKNHLLTERLQHNAKCFYVLINVIIILIFLFLLHIPFFS